MGAFLIVNADDFNLTDGVSEAILDCHDHGIVSSTTVLINRPLKKKWSLEFKKREYLGVGLHLNVTFGEPLSSAGKIKSLLNPEGQFKKRGLQLDDLPAEAHVQLEWENQIRRFQSKCSKTPTHIDTHHQLHDHPHFFKVLCQISKKWRLPVRRSSLMKVQNKNNYFSTTNFLWGDLDPARHWKKQALTKCLKKMKRGIHEVMCHPGVWDEKLQSVSSFTKGRASEWKLFRSHDLRRILMKQGIFLTDYRVCYTLPRR